MRDPRTGPEHYNQAQIAQGAAAALQANREPGPGYTVIEALLDALVHALLANAAAVALVAGEYSNLADIEMWRRVAATPDDLPPLPFTSRRGAT